jgi:hypothetical protein
MSPVPVLLIMIATFHAAIAHIWAGRYLLQLPVYWLAAFIGVVIIHATGIELSSALPAPASVHLIETSIGAWIGLFMAIRFTKQPA